MGWSAFEDCCEAASRAQLVHPRGVALWRGVIDARRHLVLDALQAMVGIIALALLAPATGACAASAAPEIAATTWLNSVPVRLADLKGRVALVEFWTFGCYNCRNVEPHVQEWHRKYGGVGLVVVGVHTPETAYERDIENVKRYVHDHHISYAVAIDSDFAIWRSYANTAWPAWYLIDKHGSIRYTHVGEGAYAETERQIELLLAE